MTSPVNNNPGASGATLTNQHGGHKFSHLRPMLMDLTLPFANNPLADIMMGAIGAMGNVEDISKEDGDQFATRLQNIVDLMGYLGNLSSEELSTLMNFGLDMATQFPDSERGAAMGAALVAGIAQAALDDPAIAERLSPQVRSRFAALAEAIDDMAAGRFQGLLSQGSAATDFASLQNYSNASDALKGAFGDKYVAPPETDQPTFQPQDDMSYDNLLARAMKDPTFALLYLAMEGDEARREQLANTLRSNFEPSEKTMMLLQKGLEDSGNFRKALMGVFDTAKEGDKTVAEGFR